MINDENFAIINPTAEKIATSANTVPPMGNPNLIASFI